MKQSDPAPGVRRTRTRKARHRDWTPRTQPRTQQRLRYPDLPRRAAGVHAPGRSQLQIARPGAVSLTIQQLTRREATLHQTLEADESLGSAELQYKNVWVFERE